METPSANRLYPAVCCGSDQATVPQHPPTARARDWNVDSNIVHGQGNSVLIARISQTMWLHPRPCYHGIFRLFHSIRVSESLATMMARTPPLPHTAGESKPPTAYSVLHVSTKVGHDLDSFLVSCQFCFASSVRVHSFFQYPVAPYRGIAPCNMLPFFHVFLFINLVLGSLGKWDAYVPWKRNILERDVEPTCSCTDPAAIAWSSDKHFADTAISAVAPTGYTQTISNAHTWTTGDGFLGVTIIDEYDAATGAFLCDSLDACSSFQIYFEKEEGSEAVIKAAFWAGAFAAADSTTANAVVAGLNGYTNNTLTTPDGFEVPSYVGNQAIRPPPGSNAFIDSKIFHGPFDTAHCSKECDALGGNFFNTYVVSKNGVNQGQYCDVYRDTLGHEWATESGSTFGRTNWTISHSFTCKWAGEKRGEDPSSSSTSASTTTIVNGGGKKGSWEHHHPWHGNSPRPTTTTTISSTTSKTSSSVPVGETTTTWGHGTFTPPVRGSSSTNPHGSSSSPVDPTGLGSTTPTSSKGFTTSNPGHSWPHDTASSHTTRSHSTTNPYPSHTTVDPHPTHTTTHPHASSLPSTTPSIPDHSSTANPPVQPTTSHPVTTSRSTTSTWAFTTTSTLIIPSHPVYNGSYGGNGTNHTWGDWLDWNQTWSSSTTSTLSVDPATASRSTTPADTTTSLTTTSSIYPSIPPFNGSYPHINWTDWSSNHTNGSHWYDWVFNGTTTASASLVDPATTTWSLTTTTTTPLLTTTSGYIPTSPGNGTHPWNGTLPNGTHWYDWIYNETTSLSTTSTLFVNPETTTTSSAYLTTSAYPSTFPWNGTLPNGTHPWNGTLPNGTHWYDWIYNETTTTTTSSTLFVDPETTTTSSAYLTTTTGAYPPTFPWNGTLPNGTHPWNGTLPNGTHWYDWLYNETTTTMTTSTLLVDPETTSTTTSAYITTTTAAYPPTFPWNGTLPNGTFPWNGTLPNGTHWYDWLNNDTTSSLTTTTTSTWSVEPITTAAPSYITTSTVYPYPTGPAFNGTLPNGTHWTDWNGTLPNGTHWYDWIYNGSSTTTITTTTTPSFVEPTTSSTTAVYITTSSAYPPGIPYNGTLPNGTWTDWNGTLPNGTHWYDWLYNGTTTIGLTSTTSSFYVEPATTTTSSYQTTTSAYPGYPPFNGTNVTWTDWNGTLPNGTHWYDWLYNGTTTTGLTTTTSSLYVEPATTTTAYQTTTSAYPTYPPFNGTIPNVTWTDWNGTLPNGTHWYDWLYNGTTTSSTISTTTSTLSVDPLTTTTIPLTTSAYPTYPSFNGSLPNMTWSDWNGTLPNGTHWYDWLYNGTTSSTTVSTTTSTLSVDPLTMTTTSLTTTSAYPTYPSFNGSLPNMTWSDWNGTLPNGTHWYDWLYNGTTSSTTVSTTTSTLSVGPVTTTTTPWTTTSAYPTYPSLNGTLPNMTWSDWNGTLPNGTHWYDWLYNGTSSSTTVSTTTSTLSVEPATTTMTPWTTTSAVPTYPAYNGSLPNGTHWTDWNGTFPLNGTLPNGTHWYDWLYNDTSSSTIMSSTTTTSILIVEPTTTSTSSMSAYPTYPSFNGTLPNGTWTDWNGTLPNGTHWYDWIYNGTTSSSAISTTTSTLFVEPTTTSPATTTTSDYPSYNGTLPNGTHWTDWNGTIPMNGTLPNGTHWYDWLYNGTTSSTTASTTTSTLFIEPTTTSSAATTTSAYLTYPGFNGTLPNGTHWTDWNGTIPLNGTLPNGTHWYDWLYNDTRSSTTSTLFVEPSTTTSVLSSSTTSTYPTYPAFNGTLPNGTHWTDWNGTIPINGTLPNGTHWYDWLYNGTTSSTTSVVEAMTTTSSLSTTSTWSYAAPTTTGMGYDGSHGNISFPHNGTQGNSSFPAFPTSNNSYPQNNASWAENGCDPTPPSQLLTNPSFECSLGGWTLVEGDVVWGGVAAPAKKKRKTRKRDIASPDLASNGKGFARLHPSSSSDTATLSQTLDTAAPNGSYWYSFDYRVPPSGDTPAECTLTVSDDEGVLQVLSGLGSATQWTKTGNEFKIKESAATFSWAFNCYGADTASPILDLDNLRLGTSNGTWSFANGTIGGAPPSNGTYSGPPVNGTLTPPPYPAVASPPPPANMTIPSPPPSHSETSYPVPTTSSSPPPADAQSTPGPDPNTLDQNTPPSPEPVDKPSNGTTGPPPDRRFRPRRWNRSL